MELEGFDTARSWWTMVDNDVDEWHSRLVTSHVRRGRTESSKKHANTRRRRVTLLRLAIPSQVQRVSCKTHCHGSYPKKRSKVRGEAVRRLTDLNDIGRCWSMWSEKGGESKLGKGGRQYRAPSRLAKATSRTCRYFVNFPFTLRLSIGLL